MNYYTFKRGSVVFVDFSPQIGSEIKGKHFAIVLTKKDRASNELLTVIPLTSKFHEYHLDLGDEIKKSIYNNIFESLEDVVAGMLSISEDTSYDEVLELEKRKELCSQVSKRYLKLQEHTYAKVHQITTISKKRIMKPVNQFDPIRKLKVSNEVMDLLDKKIIELFTKVDIN